MSYHWIRIFENETELENYILPNVFFVFELRGEKICITRTDKGYFAVQDKCPHNGASLSKGFCSKENEIICPLHRYSFDLKSGKATSGGAFALKTYPIQIKPDGVYVGIKAKWWEA
ncbi:Rieske (2Fe-2S) protein [Aurantibacillus circumpalustris]|uniref:Rieske (2Fe-2S) protein n=1 Tax=Aurantibacillus circumpalustris TaxID=3036359 RepID=UPI00295AE349|nr:Rieske 2Fe-2S domain-containing protein [Aurantibacillus circumpalustris]